MFPRMKSANFWRENPAKEYPISSGNYQNTENPRDILILVHGLHFVSVFGSGISILDPQHWIQKNAGSGSGNNGPLRKTI
jgi:hypothetical protein